MLQKSTAHDDHGLGRVDQGVEVRGDSKVLVEGDAQELKGGGRRAGRRSAVVAIIPSAAQRLKCYKEYCSKYQYVSPRFPAFSLIYWEGYKPLLEVCTAAAGGDT